MRGKIIALISSLTLGMGLLIAPLSAATATTTTIAAAPSVSKACVKAKKELTLAKKALRKASRPGTLLSVNHAALKRWTKAENNVKKRCKVSPPNTGNTGSTGTANTFSGNINDPRPAGWVRPPDGSGLPGSNTPLATITPSSCPVTVSKVSTASFPIDADVNKWVVEVDYQNYTNADIPIHIEVDAVKGDGTNLNSNPKYGIPGRLSIINETTTAMSLREDLISTNIVMLATEDISQVRILAVRLTCS